MPRNLYLTNNGGDTWSLQTMPINIDPERVSAIKNTPGTYVISSDSGIWTTTDNFITLYPIDPGAIRSWTLLMYDASIGWTEYPINYSDSALRKITHVITGIREVKDENTASPAVFPNPVRTGYAMLSWKAYSNGVTELTLFDLSGRMLKKQSKKCAPGKNAEVFDFRDVSPGMYLLRLEDADQAATVRVLVQ